MTGDTQPFTADNQKPAIHKSIGHMEAKEYREALKARREKGLQVIDLIYERALAPDAGMQDLVAAARQHEASNDRIDGKAAQSVDMTSGGGPLTVVIRRFTEDVPE